MTGKLVGLMQMLPFPGKLSLATDMAEYEAAAVKHQQEEIRNQIIQMVKNLYYDLYAVDRALEITEKNRELIKQLIQITEIRYTTGAGLQQDVLRAQVELSKLEDDLIMWEQNRLAVVAQLNSLLNRPVNTSVKKTRIENFLPQFIKEDFFTEKIEQSRPLLRSWQERIQKTEAASKLALRDLWPNFTLGAIYSQRNDLSDGRQMPDFFSATVSINIPLFANRKQKARIAEKQLALNAIKAEYENVKINVLAEIEKISAELERNRKRFDLYKGGILLQAQQSLESAQAGYQVGKVDFLTLISNWMMLQNYELQFHFATAGFYKKLADLEFALGREIKFLEE
jgi:outer membrane protein TolC